MNNKGQSMGAGVFAVQQMIRGISQGASLGFSPFGFVIEIAIYFLLVFMIIWVFTIVITTIPKFILPLI